MIDYSCRDERVRCVHFYYIRTKSNGPRFVGSSPGSPEQVIEYSQLDTAQQCTAMIKMAVDPDLGF